MDTAFEDPGAKPLHIREVEHHAASGFRSLFAALGLVAVSAAFLATAATIQQGAGMVLAVVCAVLLFVAAFLTVIGLFSVAPNQARVLQLFGNYVGTVKSPGLWWANPFYSKVRVTLRVRNFESEKLKVNDHTGNPIQIAAIVVWKVIDTAEALFHVESYEHFVKVQTEAAVRNLATRYAYDAHGDGEMSLRSHTAEVAEHLKTEVQDRLTQAGVLVIEARISHLAYAPEIAGVMLQRQQASAVIAARSMIVEGAVGMVEMALEMLSTKNIVVLDDERKAAMVSNLLIVLCGDRGTQPVVNAGTLGT